MEVGSAAAALLGVLDIALRTTSALIKYTQDVKNASTDRQLLAEETTLLFRILQRLQNRAQSSNVDSAWLADQEDIVRHFQRACDDLVASLKLDVATGRLKPESRLGLMKTAAKWSFNKSEVYSLLERVTRLQQYANSLLVNDQGVLIDLIDKRQQEVANKKLKLAILSWLSPLQMAQSHNTISERAESGSGRWFLTSDKFLDWHSGANKSLWCSGIRMYIKKPAEISILQRLISETAGAGKTVIASIVANHLFVERQRDEQANRRTAIAIIYLKYNDPEQTLNTILGSILKQFLQDCESIQDILRDMYNGNVDPKSTPSSIQISTALSSLAKSYYDEIFLVVDALDECSDEIRWGLIEVLDRLPNTRLIITSRFFDVIEEDLHHFERFEIKAHRADIELFINQQIEKNKNLRKMVEKAPKIREDIMEGVVQTAQDMFLLARLHVDSLANAAALPMRHVRNKLQSLPTTLQGTYEEAMRRIDSQDPEYRGIALKTLAWITYAFRSLSMKELQHALALEPTDKELDEELVMDGHSITALCAGLVVLDPATDNVNLVHYTAKHYFENNRHIYFPGFHGTITMSCATYLTLPALQNATIWKLVREYPLSCYAAEYVGEHARQHPEETLELPVLEMVYQLLAHPENRKPLISLLDGLYLIKSGFYSSKAISASNPTLCVSEDGQVGNYQHSAEEETLKFASASASSEEGESILTPDDPSSCAEKEPFYGEMNNAGSSKSMARSMDPDIEERRTLEITALHLAASMGLSRVASMLIQETSDIDAIDETGKTPLAVAMERGFEKAVEFLINSGASVDLRTEHGRQVLLLVSEKNWEGASSIIAEKAHEQAKDSAPVHLLLASYHGSDAEALRLIEGEHVNLRAGDRNIGEFALFMAIERNHPSMAKILLRAGVDVDSKDNIGQTALHRATRRENKTLMKILLEAEADVESRNDDGRTPWSANTASRNDSVLDILLQAGANPNTQGIQGVTALYLAASAGELEYVKFLLKSGTDPSINTQFGWAPMHWAAYNGHYEVVRQLVDNGAKLSPVSDQDTTPLDLAIRSNQIPIIDLLTRAGAKRSEDIRCRALIQAHDESQRMTSTSADCEPSVESKLSLIFDRPIRPLDKAFPFGQFVYATSQPDTSTFFPYQISQMLDTVTNVISVRRAESRPRMSEYPLRLDRFLPEHLLYDIVRMTPDYQELKLCSNIESPVPGTIRLHRDWTGGWKAYQQYQGRTVLLFRTNTDWLDLSGEGTRWSAEDESLIARSGHGETALTFEPNVDGKLQDVIVTCWIAKTWAETVGMHKHTVDDLLAL